MNRVRVLSKSSPAIGDTAVAELSATLSPEELSAARRRDFVAKLPVIDPKSYQIKGEVAQGGIGRILRARDERLDRPVALKELLTNSGAAAADRFVREARITARLQHPSIVPLYEAGRWPTGEPFYAMKYVAGRSLADVILATRTLDQRLGLLPHVLAVAEAMAYAHSERIIHRDLKPANILVGDFGETVVIDWGLAKDLAEDEPASSDPAVEGSTAPISDGAPALTMHGAVIGTPAYMPLEQAMGKRVDERADVYALGAILYHLLAGICPYDGDSAVGILRQVIDAPPPPLEARQKGLPEDLITIVKKAMARDAADRYPSANELADDLRRFQTGQIVGAHKYSTVELFRRFARRYRAALAVAAAALLVMGVVGAIGLRKTIDERRRAVAGENQALAAQQKAVEHADDLTLVQARAAASRDPNEALAWLKSLSPSFTRWPEARLIAADAQAQGLATVLRGHTALINRIAFSPDGKLLGTTSDDHTARLWDTQTGEARVLSGHADEVWSISFSPSGRIVATGSKDKTIRVWDVATGALRQTLIGHARAVPVLMFADEDTLASEDHDALVRVWDLRTGEGRTLPGRSKLRGRPMSPDGRHLALATPESNLLMIADLKTGEIRSFAGHERPIVAVAFSPDGRSVASRSKDGITRLWDLASGKGENLGDSLPFDPRLVVTETAIVFSPDSKQIAISGEDSLVHLVDTTTGKRRALAGHEGRTTWASFSPDGTLVAAGSDDHTVRVWDLARGESRVLRGFEDSVRYTAFSPDGKLLAAAGADFNVRLFPATKPPSRVLLEQASPLQNVTFSPDGARLLTSGADGALRLIDLASGARALLSGHAGQVFAQAFSPRGDLIASSASDGAVRVWNLEGHEIWSFESHGQESALELYEQRSPICFSPDGRLLAATDREGHATLLDVDTGQTEPLAPGSGEGPTDSIAFSPDGKRLATGSRDGAIRVWDLERRESRILAQHEMSVLTLAFSPDGAILASGSVDHTLAFWNVESGEGARVAASGGGIAQIVFTHDGRRALTMGIGESGIRLWDVPTSKETAFLRGHAGGITGFSISPDDERAATVGLDGTVRIWDLASGQGRVLRGHAGPAGGVAFSPDGKLLASVGADQTLRLWADDLPLDGPALRAFIDAATADTIAMYHRCAEDSADPLPVR